MRRRPISNRRRGFTLIEVLATLTLVAIVLPAIMKGVTLASTAAVSTRRHAEAGGLAESKLASLVVSGDWQNGSMSGDFSADGWPDYRWDASVQTWGDGTVAVQELDLKVTWLYRDHDDSVTLSTLVYQRTTSQ